MDINSIIQVVSSLNWLEILGAAYGLILALIAIFALIPGEQPEKTLKAIANIIAKFSRK
jgi:hypothetical protein